MRNQKAPKEVIVIKPIGWRQFAFTLFLIFSSLLFAFIDFGGLIASWIGTIVLGLVALLNLLDQLCEWSRLKIDRNGYHLRGWLRKQSFEHREIDRFELTKFANRFLIALVLKSKAQTERGLDDPHVPFPCAFGRPVEQVIETLQGSLKKKKI
jgi:hypothetical protein